MQTTNQQELISHFKTLLKIDTTNPPGNEMEAILYLKDVLRKAGVEAFIQETDKNRGNLVARLKGNGSKKPLLISSHVDVVPAEPEYWSHPPFAAVEDQGLIYGRGTIDMKNFTAMCLTTFLEAQRKKWPLKRDLILSVVSDEERGGRHGMKALVSEHPELIQAEFALGEVGGYTAYLGNKAIYPIQVGEKGTFWIRTKWQGQPGHGSFPTPENIHWQIGRFLSRLESYPFAYHRTRSFQAFLKAISRLSSPVTRWRYKLLDSPYGPKLLKNRISKGQVQNYEPILLAMMTNTVNPTGLLSGKAPNVVPSTCELTLDCRTIPGCDGTTVIREIEKATGVQLMHEVISTNPGHETSLDTPLYANIVKTLKKHHPEATAVPWLTVGYTDAGELQKLGIKCYGFTPVRLPQNLRFSELYHGHNERIPIDGLFWGQDVFQELVYEFCCEQ